MNKDPKPQLPAGVEIHGANLRVSFTYQHIRCRESLGIRPTKQNIKFAAGKLAAIKHEIAIGSFDYAAHFPKSRNIIINKHQKGKNARIDWLADQFMEHKGVDVRMSTLNKYRRIFASILPLYGCHRVSKTLSKTTISKWRRDIVKGKTARSANSYLSCLSVFLKWLYDEGYIQENLSSIKRIKQPNMDPDPFSLDEYNIAINACAHEQHKNMITVLAYTGIRIGEMCGLAWQDIDLENGTMKISRSVNSRNGQYIKTTKTDKERIVFLLPPALSALRSQFGFTGHISAEPYHIELSDKTTIVHDLSFVFTPSITRAAKRKYCGESFVSAFWSRLCQQSGIRHRRAYQWRHTYASWMLTAGVNPSYLASQMGHANFQMIANVYAKWMPSSSQSEHERAIEQLKKMGQIAPLLPHEK
ncbi:putative defective protein IntQ [Photobacterium damselae subsp. damselae]|uniref:site-specific integrase n=1 Tax=Photobacterium damselae TaxID=38293 RepID=UPI00109BF368|nr:site-specific integrase [Photobacterium damselae]TGZ35330.1 putative defective protein IntQ [Photobacterium damselae subsp. damselae]